MLDFLRERFEIRYKNIEERAAKFSKTTPDKEQLWEILKTRYLSNFKCEYCNEPLMIKDTIPPYLHSFSFDHKQSLFSGGNNDLTNFAIVCTQCNITKGTMDTSTFKLIIKYLPKDIRLKMFQTNYSARLANKLEREKTLTLEAILWDISKKFKNEFYIPPTCPKCLKPLSGVISSNTQICLNCNAEYRIVEK